MNEFVENDARDQVFKELSALHMNKVGPRLLLELLRLQGKWTYVGIQQSRALFVL